MQNSFAKKTLKNTLLAGVSVAAVSLGIDVASAQQSEEVDELIVQGIRKSLQSSSDLKRNAKGIVDAISAEEMGKFPDTNLAESLKEFLVFPLTVNVARVQQLQFVVSGLSIIWLLLMAAKLQLLH